MCILYIIYIKENTELKQNFLMKYIYKSFEISTF